MSFVTPLALLLLLPLCGLLLLVRHSGAAMAHRLPGAWQSVVAPGLRRYLALRSKLGRAGAPILCFGVAGLLVLALSRPGLDAPSDDAFSTLAGRVVIIDVGSDLARHRQILEDLHRADPAVSTALVAVSGDAYRIVPFTTDKSQIDRYLRVMSADVMPRPGRNAHLALALAERVLSDAGLPIRQIVLLSARSAPENLVEVPPADSERFIVPIGTVEGWSDWAAAQNSRVLSQDELAGLNVSLRSDANALAQSELASSRNEFTVYLIAIAALLWLLLFRRRSA
jgi:hypothetical protein